MHSELDLQDALEHTRQECTYVKGENMRLKIEIERL